MNILIINRVSRLIVGLSLLLIYQTSHAQYDILIKKINKSSCYKNGEAIEISGRGFGKKNRNKNLVINNGSNEYTVNNVQLWSSGKITATLPSQINTEKTNNFIIGIRVGSTWASNRDQNIIFCSSTGTIRTPRVTLPPKLTTTLPDRAIPDRNKPSTATDPTAREPKTREPSTREPSTTRPTTKSEVSITPEPDINTDLSVASTATPNINTFNTNIRNTTSLQGLGTPPKVELGLTSQSNNEEQQEPKEVMVISASMQEAIELAEVIKQYNIRIKRRTRYTDIGIVLSILAIPQDLESANIIEQLREYDPTLWIDFNHRYQLLGNTNTDPKQWAYQKVGWSPSHTECGQGLKMGVIDTGITNETGEHIIEKSFLPSGIKMASRDHGTAIGSLLLGSRSHNMAGLTPRATLYSAAIFRQRKTKHIDTTAEYIIAALNWLASENIPVINMSFGGPRNLPVELVIKRLTQRGFTIFSAAGIDKNNQPLYPAAQDEVLAVRAIDINNKVFTENISGSYIDFSAPGVDLWLLNAEGKGRYLSGSSFATPFAAASYLLLNNSKHAHDSSHKLIELSQDLGVQGKDPYFGFGLVRLPTSC